jgi:flagellar protein FlgJ
MVSDLNTTTSLAIDTQSLGALRAQAKKSPDQALKAAAQQFEAVFMNMMLKSMREATPKDGMMDSEQTKMFTGMLDQQLTQNLSGRGIGLADMMVKQLSRNGQVMPSLPTVQPPILNLPPSLLNPQSQVRDAVPSAFSANTQQDFVNKMLPSALQASQASGVPPQLILGQAALESGWGKREITMPDGGSSYNLFGIKANAGWSGKVAEVMTTEYKNGVPSKQVEKFRAYASYAEAFKDYAAMLSNNPRYANVMQQAGNPAGMAQELQKSGYATDPKYAPETAPVE